MTQVTRTYDDAEWQLVPKDPTTEMLRARDGISNVVSIYRTMLAAAPQPPAVRGSPVETDDLTAEAIQFMAIFDKACEQPDPWAYLISAANLQQLQGAIDNRLKQGGAAGELPEWPDPRVQAVYALLNSSEIEESMPKGEHWDGWVSRHIVAALAPAAVQPGPVGVVTDSDLRKLRSIIETIKGGAENWPNGWSGTVGNCDAALDILARAAVQGSEPRDAVEVDAVHAHFTPFYLLANARRIVNRGMARSANWVLAMELFAVGSTSAHRICEEAGIDPNSVKVTRAAIAACTGSKG